MNVSLEHMQKTFLLDMGPFPAPEILDVLSKTYYWPPKPLFFTKGTKNKPWPSAKALPMSQNLARIAGRSF